MNKQERRPLCFLDLPPELRNIIYEFALRESPCVRKGDRVKYGPAAHWLLRPRNTQIHDTTRQIRHECFSVPWTNVDMRFWITKDNVNTQYKAWAAFEDPRVLSYVKRIALEDWQHYNVQYPVKHRRQCNSQLVIDMREGAVPVKYTRDGTSTHCPQDEQAVNRVNAVVRALEEVEGRRLLTMTKLWEIFEIAVWEASDER